MKSFKNILALAVLFFATSMFAEILTDPTTLPDGTVIPAGADMIIGDDGTMEYQDTQGIVLAQVRTIISGNSTSYSIIRRIADGSYVQVTVSANGVVSTPISTAAPTAVIPTTGGGVGGSQNTQGPTGVSIPNNAATVI